MLEQSYLVTFLRDARKKVTSAGGSSRTITFADGGRLQLVPGLYANVEREMTGPDHPNFRLVLDAIEQPRALANQWQPVPRAADADQRRSLSAAARRVASARGGVAPFLRCVRCGGASRTST